MPDKNDLDWFKQTLRATFPYIVFILTFIVGTFVIILWASHAESAAGGPVRVLLGQAHSHNDYNRKHPLDDALDLGFCSVEADIYLVDGALLVAHDLRKAVRERNLRNLYLEPLWERYKAQGSIYATPAPFTLLIDIKSDGKTSFAALHDVLKPFAPMLTHFTSNTTTPGAVTVIISGNRAMDAILASEPRLAGVDGRLSDLDGAYTAHEMPLISDNWLNNFTWRGKGEMPTDEQAKLKDIVKKAHGKGMRVRFWATPQRPSMWKALYRADVDLLNADNLPKLRTTLLEVIGEKEAAAQQ